MKTITTLIAATFLATTAAAHYNGEDNLTIYTIKHNTIGWTEVVVDSSHLPEDTDFVYCVFYKDGVPIGTKPAFKEPIATTATFDGIADAAVCVGR